MNTISERLQFVAKDNKIPVRDIARSMSLSDEEYEEKIQSNQFDIDDVYKFCNVYSEVNFAWLATGIGEKYTRKPQKRDVYDYTGVNKQVKRIRVQNGLSQAEMAEILGISRTTMSAIERNIQTIQIAQMKILNRRFGVSYDLILDQEERDSKIATELFKCRKKNEQYKKLLISLNIDKSLL